MVEEYEVVIVGAGIAGVATALALNRLGVQSLRVLERAEELRTTGTAITISSNGWHALDALGVADKLTSVYGAYKTGSVTNLDVKEKTSLNFSQNRDGMGEGFGVRPVHRKALLEAVAEELAPDTIRFSSKLASIKSEVLNDSWTVTDLHLEDGTIIRAKVLIGCDGVHSVVAQWLGLAAPIDSGRSAVRGLAIYEKSHGLKNEVHQFLSTGKRAGIVPLNDYEIYWFITCPSTQRVRDMAKDYARNPQLILREVTDNLAKEFPSEYLEAVRKSDPSSLTWAPLMFRSPWAVITGPNHKGTVTVAGDAMHPMTPDLAQGGCSALEDAVVLARNIARSLSSDGRMMSFKGVEEGLECYVKERKWRVAGLIVGAYLSGWVQEGGTGLWAWVVRLIRDHVFYRFLFRRIAAAVDYDCGDLPTSA